LPYTHGKKKKKKKKKVHLQILQIFNLENVKTKNIYYVTNSLFSLKNIGQKKTLAKALFFGIKNKKLANL
jgi:hypothetical protein